MQGGRVPASLSCDADSFHFVGGTRTRRRRCVVHAELAHEAGFLFCYPSFVYPPTAGDGPK